MKKLFLYIILFISLCSKCTDVNDLIYNVPYSQYTMENLKNVKFKKYDDNLWTYLFIDRHLRINLSLNPFVWFSNFDEDNSSKYTADGIPIEYFNFKISWNF